MKIILSRPTECFLILRKYRNGRQSTLCYGKLYSHGRQNTLCCKKEYSSGRQSIIYICGNTLTADRGLPHFAKTSWRPTEYFHEMMEYFDGRQSTRCDRMEYYNGRQCTCYDGRSTMTADRVSISNLQYHWNMIYSIILSLPNVLFCQNLLCGWGCDFVKS